MNHALYDHCRRADPLRVSLANRVRDVLTHTRGLALWGREPALCWLEEWEGQESATR